MGEAPRFTVQAIEVYERDVRLRLPFRFGVVTLTAAPQAFVRARITLADGRAGWGGAAELLAPKWFDKSLALSNEDNFEQLRTALAMAGAAYASDASAASAFGHFERHYSGQLAGCAARGLNALVASFGPALVDRAILDALCRLRGMSFYEAIRANVAGIRAQPLAGDLVGFDLDAFLAGRTPAVTVAARHTVGLIDPITAGDVKAPLNDGLPETLEEVIATYGHRHFKLKLGGDVAADLDRLLRIASVIDRIEAPYFVTLDGNEQFQDVETVVALWRRLLEAPPLARLAASTLLIEQPLERGAALARSVARLAALKPIIIDESDAELDTFVRAKALGYTGVSSKSCKGFYKSILNAARCALWNTQAGARYFISGEDLTGQAGLALQQDLALVALLGLGHVERNGHHYVNGLANAPRAEQLAFLRAHPDLYQDRAGAVRVRIERGALAIASLACPGFASGVEPEWAAMRPMAARP